MVKTYSKWWKNVEVTFLFKTVDLTDNEIKKLKVHHNSQEKSNKELKGRVIFYLIQSGFFDAGTNATID